MRSFVTSRTYFRHAIYTVVLKLHPFHLTVEFLQILGNVYNIWHTIITELIRNTTVIDIPHLYTYCCHSTLGELICGISSKGMSVAKSAAIELKVNMMITMIMMAQHGIF